RSFEGDIDLITDIYLLDVIGRVITVVPVVQVLLAQPQEALAKLPQAHLVTCQIETGGRKVAELFDKYNLRALPVVDVDKKLVGVVHAEQVISLLRNH
ncbi:MAG TPA: CBS domain-containing protein, partial [Edaphobacter sp.]|nr:CBS domain-containing protein [Edaphobacter sp.]